MRDSHDRVFMLKRQPYGTGSSALVAAMYMGLVRNWWFHAACAENRKRKEAVFQVEAIFLKRDHNAST